MYVELLCTPHQTIITKVVLGDMFILARLGNVETSWDFAQN